MIKVDLITGFLGSGKTTFLKLYASYLMRSGEKICIIENDFGAINVDMVLLQEIAGENCNLEMIVGGDGKEAHKRRLKTKLIAMGMSGYDRVIIEPSGIFDLDEFFDVLYEEPLDRWYAIGNVISIVDSTLEDDISKKSRYLLMSETASAGVAVLSKLSSKDDPNIAKTINRLIEVNEEFGCKRGLNPVENVIAVPWDELGDSDFFRIVKCGYNNASYPKMHNIDSEGYQTLFYFDFKMEEQELIKTVKEIFQDSSCGHIFRIKGFIDIGEKTKLQLNATKNMLSTEQICTDRAVLIVIGEDLNPLEIKKYLGNPSI